MSASHASDVAVAPPPSAAGPQVQAWRLLATLGLAGAVAGLLLVFVFVVTRPTIEANKAAALDAAIQEVLKAPKRYETLYVVKGALVKDAPAGIPSKALQRVYVGYADDGRRVGFAIPAEAHHDVREKQRKRVFEQGAKPSDEGLEESQAHIGSMDVHHPEKLGA